MTSTRRKSAISPPIAAISTSIFGPLLLVGVVLMTSPSVTIAVEDLESFRFGVNELVPEFSTILLYSIVLDLSSEIKYQAKYLATHSLS